jgi:hypothetical protein
MNEQHREPVCTFYRLIPNAPLPRRADPSADGMIPTRGYRYCAVSGMASASGFYVFPPIDFSLVWTGKGIAWTYDGAKDWYPLKRAQYPGFRDFFKRNAPKGIGSLAPTFLGASRDSAMVQIWSGLLARTAPGWALISRAPVNIPRAQDYEQFDGIFQSEFWFGPLFTNIKLTEKNSPVEFERRYPLLQAQPILHQCYVEPSFATLDFADLDAGDWEAFERTMRPNADPTRRLGHHAVEVRRHLKRHVPAAAGCPYHQDRGPADRALPLGDAA